MNHNNLAKHIFLENYVEHIEQSFIVSKTDLKGIITYVNNKFCEISKYSREELIGQPHNIVRHPEMPKHVFSQMWKTIQNKEIFQNIVKNRAKDGSTYIVEAKIFPIVVDGEIVEYVSIRTDITKYEQEKERRIYTDDLTKVFNRLKFNELLELEIKNMRRFRLPFSVALLDIDHFKNFNDTYGHLVGDEVLIMIAQYINTHIRKTDIFARWGGEEFILFFKGTDINGAECVTNKLREAISKLKHSDIDINITVSFGITEYQNNDTLDIIFKRCDDALYKAKQLGRNRVEIG